MAEDTSIWKKEIRLRRRRSPAAAPTPAAVPAALDTGEMSTGEKKPSIWKREIKLGRSAGSLSHPALPADPSPSLAPPDEPALEPGVPHEPVEDHGHLVHAEPADSESRASLFEPAPQWEGAPPALPSATDRALPVPPEEAAAEWSDADEPDWERAQPEADAGGAWSLDWEHENESGPQGWPATSQPAESGVDHVAALPANPVEPDDPPVWEYQREAEAPPVSERQLVPESQPVVRDDMSRVTDPELPVTAGPAEPDYTFAYERHVEAEAPVANEPAVAEGRRR